MKKLILICLLFPCVNQAQTVVTLNLNQPDEFGFETGKQDTTITKGESVVLGYDLIIYGGSGEYSFLWTPGKSLNDSTLMKPIASPEDTTLYQLLVTDVFGCSFTTSYKVYVQTSATFVQPLNTQDHSLKFNLFPNPNAGEFTVQLNGEPSEKIQFVVIDNFGRTLHEQTIINFQGEHTESLKINLPNGAYNLLIRSETVRIQHPFIIK